MSRSSQPARRRGRPRRSYRVRVVGERRASPDYDKLAHALLEHAAMQSRQTASSTTVDPVDEPDVSAAVPDDPEAAS